MTENKDERLRAALGFAMKAGRAASGRLAAEKALRSGRAMAAVLDSAASEQSKKHWRSICENAGVPLVFAEDVGRAVGREAHTIVCITDSGFARMIMSCRNENEQ
ncbi:MAG: ribosomal L7Ae/L30e/S12e/Gadd45 family protein [Clostridia bacterium]|jgi:ribosomal protein L7Ae-like RNA K-turn-binding protein|nr:ribosomal L7Ae/L30e/S12e/Gadd45 family protein [Clostridia bacterium]